MATFFKRIFRFGKAEAHAVLDQFEDPIKMAEQGIRELKSDLQKTIQSLAEVKAMSIRAKRQVENKKQRASEYEKKAMLLLQKGQSGEMNATDVDRLASECLDKKEMAVTDATRNQQEVAKHQALVTKLESNVNILKSKISTWENELTTLRARAKVSAATKKLNKQLAQADSNDTIAMLEKMKEKVDQDEALAESYGDIAAAETSVDDEINKALSGGSTVISQKDSLAALKAKMGMS